MGLFSNLKSKSIEKKFKDKVLEASAELDQVSKLCSDFKHMSAISNTKMLLKAATDRFINYTEAEIEEIFGFISCVTEDISAAAVGVSSFNGEAVESATFEKSVSAYLSLLAFYLYSNLSSGAKKLSIKDAEEHRQAISRRQKNERLELQADDIKKQIEKCEAEREEKERRKEEILERARSGECNETEKQRLLREFNSVKAAIEGIDKKKARLGETLTATNNQITDNKEFEGILKATEDLETVLSSRSYGSVDDFCRAYDIYTETISKVNSGHETISEYCSSGNSSEEEVYDPELAGAFKEGENNKLKKQNKEQDDELFFFQTEQKNAN